MARLGTAHVLRKLYDTVLIIRVSRKKSMYWSKRMWIHERLRMGLIVFFFVVEQICEKYLVNKWSYFWYLDS